MYQKASQVLDLLERFINIIRTKAHNKIANMVIGAGLLQIAEAHAKILHAFSIALFEEYIAKSAILRDFLNATSDSTTGLIMIAMGLTYHLIAYLGKDFIDAIKAKQPKTPELQLQLLNGDKTPLTTEFTIRGERATTPSWEDIPLCLTEEDSFFLNNALPENIQHHLHQLEMLNRSFNTHENKNLYRERAEFINKWACSELLYLSLSNISTVLTNDIHIELKIPKSVSSISIEDKFIHLPESSESIIPILNSSHFTHQPKLKKIYDHIEITQTRDDWLLSWKAHKLHGQTSIESSECFLLKVTEETTIECTVCCDELPKPYKVTFKAKPPQKSSIVALEELMDDRYYDALLNRVVMDGYVSRMANEFNL